MLYNYLTSHIKNLYLNILGCIKYLIIIISRVLFKFVNFI